MSAREAILDRVRAARRTGRVPAVDSHSASAWPSAPRPTEREPDVDALVERFRRELEPLGVECFVEASAGAVRARVEQLARGQSVFSWDPDRLPYGVGEALKSPVTGSDSREMQEAAALGITGCHAAIAETGSIVVLSGPGTPRAASLLPPVHLCLVRPADLYGSMGEFFRRRAPDIQAASCCTFITGPSRTADIELTLTLGVHGPGRVIVVVGP